MYVSNFEKMFQAVFSKISHSNISDTTCSSRTMVFFIKTWCISCSLES